MKTDKERIDAAANNATPQGYTLWDTYPDRAEAARIKRAYGSRSDLLLPVPGFEPWHGLYGIALGAGGPWKGAASYASATAELAADKAATGAERKRRSIVKRARVARSLIDGALGDLNKACQSDEVVNQSKPIGRVVERLNAVLVLLKEAA